MHTDKRHATHPDQVTGMSSQRMRDYYLVSRIFEPGAISLTHSHVERMIVGGAVPLDAEIVLESCAELATGPLLAMRELGIINIGGPGRVIVDGDAHPMNPRDGLYVAMGTSRVSFASTDASSPAKYYIVSTPAHVRFETTRIPIERAKPMPMGSLATSNERVIYKYVDPEVCRSAQLLLGLTSLKEGSVWNTMPCHRHERRSETYFYFDMKPDARVFHFMGEPQETRHLVVASEQAVISPPWSIHTGCGTSNYSFIWAMGGENIDYRDMQGVPMDALR